MVTEHRLIISGGILLAAAASFGIASWRTGRMHEPKPPEAEEILARCSTCPTCARACEVHPVVIPAGIHVKRSEIDLGDIHLETTVETSISLTNGFDHAIEIDDIVPSCGCTSIELDDKHIEPGATRSIPVMVENEARDGRAVSETINIIFTDPALDPVTVVIRYSSKELLRAIPRTFRTDVPEQQTLLVESTDGQAFTIISIEPSIFDVDQSSEATEHRVPFDREKWEDLGRPDNVTITTTHPSVPSIRLRVR